MQAVYRVAVLGGGSFGTAIANMIAENGHDVVLWLRNEKRAHAINQTHCNSDYLPELSLSPNLVACSNLEEAVRDVSLIFVAVPSKSFSEVAKQLSGFIDKHVALVSLTKGIDPHRFELMSQVLLNHMPENPVAVMSGPNLAKEIAEQHLTASVIASDDEDLVKQVQELLQSRYFRVYASSDMYGVELAGALKNCYAIMCGMATALGCGQNTLGMLMTRSLAEMSRFAVKMGANPMTFLGLSGVGDLIVTCMSPLSRNYRVGYALGEGRPLEDIIRELGQVAEGVNTLQLVKAKAESLGVYMPLVSGMYDILHNGKSIEEVVDKLMLAEQNNDVEFTITNNNN